jgi:glycerol uptake facilitator-like aquaporin
VSFVDAAFGGLRWRDAAAYLPAQVGGCVAGAVVANLMFGLTAVSISAKDRASPAHFLSEVVATLGGAQITGGLLAFILVKALYPDVTPQEAAGL